MMLNVVGRYSVHNEASFCIASACNRGSAFLVLSVVLGTCRVDVSIFLLFFSGSLDVLLLSSHDSKLYHCWPLGLHLFPLARLLFRCPPPSTHERALRMTSLLSRDTMHRKCPTHVHSRRAAFSILLCPRISGPRELCPVLVRAILSAPGECRLSSGINSVHHQ